MLIATTTKAVSTVVYNLPPIRTLQVSGQPSSIIALVLFWSLSNTFHCFLFTISCPTVYLPLFLLADVFQDTSSTDAGQNSVGWQLATCEAHTYMRGSVVLNRQRPGPQSFPTHMPYCFCISGNSQSGSQPDLFFFTLPKQEVAVTRTESFNVHVEQNILLTLPVWCHQQDGAWEVS